jgi:large subunit ribosomal protein L4
MLEAPLYSATGARAASFALPADLFDGTVNEPVLHQAVVTFLNNQRQGTAATRTRARVSGGNQKPWRQKGTGRARQGTIRAPQWRGGGVVFGPHPRDYRTRIPAKVRQLARRSALNARAREGALVVIEPLAFEAPKTARLVELLGALELGGRKVLLLTDGVKSAVYRSGRNLPAVHVMPWVEASAYDILWSDVLVVERPALGGAEPVARAEAAPARPARRPAVKRAAKKPAARAAKAPASRRPAGAKAKAAPRRGRTTTKKKKEE